MLYRSFQELQLSRLGFGTMRLPQLPQGGIDEELSRRMVEYAFEQGINYFDTAYPYHGGRSELVLGKALKRLPREKFHVADKFPGHEIRDSYDPAGIFETQLNKVGVDYFDFYLLHNIYENSVATYYDERWGIVDYFLKQKASGRIRHLGFSFHGRPALLYEFLERYGEQMEFCQIQLNYLDWNLQDAKSKYQILAARNIPVWVMEPVRGGKLAALPGEDEAALKALRPEASVASWAFRFLQGLNGVCVTLSGMSDMAQMEDNIRTYEAEKPLSQQEKKLLYRIADGLADATPCTACRYCCNECPMELDIPRLIRNYDDCRFAPGITAVMAAEALPENKRPSACIGCGSCTRICPQNIPIPDIMRKYQALLDTQPSWTEISRIRGVEEDASSRG